MELRFADTLIQMPDWWLTALIIWVGLLGVILWLLGRKLVRPVLGLAGLVAGAALAMGFVRARWPEAPALPWAIAGSIITGIAAWMMWRLAVGVGLAVIIAIIVPWTVLAWTDIPPPPMWEPLAAAAQQMSESLAADDGPIDVAVVLGEAWTSVTEAWTGWWNGLEGGNQWLLMGAGVGAGTLALLVGLALPGLGAALLTAMLGAAMMSPATGRLLALAPADVAAWAPATPRQYVVILGLVSVIGAVIQWAIFRRSADK